MSHRLSRKEIKRDEFAEAVERIFETIREQAPKLIAAGVALLLVVAAVLGYRAYSANREAKAGVALDGALKLYSAPIDAEAATPDDPEAPTFASREARAERAVSLFSQLREDFGGTASADIALAYLGRLAADAGHFDEARQHWQQFIDRVPDGLLSASIRMDLMRLDIADGRGEEVASLLDEMLASGDRSLPEDLILYQLASARETLGLDGEAMAAYQRIVDEHPSSPYSTVARQKLAALPAEDTSVPLSF